MNEINKQRVTQLDSLRFIFCLVIIFSHFEFLSNSSIGDFYDTYLHNASMAVDFFFILSGFGLYYSNKANIDISIKNNIRFAIDRVKKIYPFYLISILVGIPITIFLSLTKRSLVKTIILYGAKMIPIPFLVQSLFGTSKLSHAFNGVCWFLSCLFICYIVCPLFYKLVNKTKNPMRDIFITILVIIGLSIIFLYIQNNFFNGLIDDLWYGHPIIRSLYLLIGMYIAYIYIYIKRLR